MAIRMVPDLGAPILTTAVDLITEEYAPNYNEWAAYILAVGGYVGAFMGKGGDFGKNVAISSLPWAAKKLYDRIRGGTTSRARSLRFTPSTVSRTPVSRRPIRRYPAEAPETQFRGVRITGGALT